MIRFQMLGALDLRNSGGREIGSVLAQPKRTALLAYLAVASPCSFRRRDTLLGLFWPESDQSHARDSLRQAVRYLRRSVGEGVVVGRGDEELGVDEALLWCDAAAFEQAVDTGEFERALDLYQGDLLVGFFLPDVPEFERWLERERGRLRARAVEAAWAVAETRESERDPAGATRYARRAMELCPDDEGTLRRLIILLDRLGDRASAVRAYEEFAARLAKDCGIEPSGETRGLVDRVCARDLRPEHVGLHADVDSDSAAAGPSTPPHLEAPQEHGSVEADRHEAPERAFRRPSGTLVLGSALLLLVLAGAGAIASGTRRVGDDPRRVVIIPFENRTGDVSLDPLGRWAADWIHQGLSRTHHLQVVDAAVGLPGSGSDEPQKTHLRAILDRTGRGMVVSGAYYRHGDSVQFQVQITDARGGTAVPAVEPVSGSLAQPQIAVRALGERVTGALAAHRDPWIRALNSDGSRPPSYEAYQVWVEGLQLFGRHHYREAHERLLYAASLDSTFDSPLIWAAAARGNLREYAHADSLLRIANQRRHQLLPFDRHLLDLWRAILRGDPPAKYRAARGMLEVAPASELALFLMGGAALEINHPGEAVEILRRIDVGRSGADWDAYGTRLTHAYHLLGQHDLELEEARRARERRPELLRPHFDEVRALAALGRTKEVLQLLDRVLALSPQPGVTPAGVAQVAAEELRTHGYLRPAEDALARALAWYRTRPSEEQASNAHQYDVARALYQAGRWDEAEPLLQGLLEHSPERVDYLGHLGVVAGRRGQVQEARGISKALSQMNGPYLRGSNTLWRARIAAVMGEQDEAVALLRASFAQGQAYGLAVHADPDLLPLRENPGFRRLVHPRR